MGEGRSLFEPVGSTSWHNRHAACLRVLNDLLLHKGIESPTILIIGPGGVTRVAASFLNDAENREASSLRKLIGDAARYGDQLLRRIPILPLRSLEPVEVSLILTVPHQLVVVDRSRRVLSAVARDLPHAKCIVVDISCEKIPVVADVVIAFNIVCRLEDKAAVGMAHIVETLRPGGLLLMDDRSANVYLPAGFVKVAEKIHRRGQ